jgi:hypothetical protein
MSNIDELSARLQAVCEGHDVANCTHALGRVIVNTVLAHAPSKAVARKVLDDLAAAMQKYADDLWPVRMKP